MTKNNGGQIFLLKEIRTHTILLVLWMPKNHSGRTWLSESFTVEPLRKYPSQCIGLGIGNYWVIMAINANACLHCF